MATVEEAVPEKEEKEPASVRIYLPDEKSVSDKLSSIGPGKKIDVSIGGVITGFEVHNYMPGVSLSIKPDSVSVEDGKEEISLDDAITAAQKKV